MYLFLGIFLEYLDIKHIFSKTLYRHRQKDYRVAGLSCPEAGGCKKNSKNYRSGVIRDNRDEHRE